MEGKAWENGVRALCKTRLLLAACGASQARGKGGQQQAVGWGGGREARPEAGPRRQVREESPRAARGLLSQSERWLLIKQTQGHPWGKKKWCLKHITEKKNNQNATSTSPPPKD